MDKPPCIVPEHAGKFVKVQDARLRGITAYVPRTSQHFGTTARRRTLIQFLGERSDDALLESIRAQATANLLELCRSLGTAMSGAEEAHEVRCALTEDMRAYYCALAGRQVQWPLRLTNKVEGGVSRTVGEAAVTLTPVLYEMGVECVLGWRVVPATAEQQGDETEDDPS